MPGMQGVTGASQMHGLAGQSVWYGDEQSPEDTWSNSSRGQGPIVPTTLNVEDW